MAKALIDLSILDGVQATASPIQLRKQQSGIEYHQEQQNAVEGQINATEGITEITPLTYNRFEKERQAEKRRTEAEEQQRAVYAAHQNAINKAGSLRSDITKGILNAISPYTLLLQAMECISLMTGENLFYTQNRANLGAIYGIGLLEPSPLEVELVEAQERLKMLQRPEILENEPADSIERIKRAIKAHQEREKVILKYLELERGT